MKELLLLLTSAWWGILLIVLVALIFWLALSVVLYRVFFKRFYDFVLSFIALILFSPILLLLTVIGAIVMKGNPFFTQARPGKINKKTGKEKIFKLIKFRTMSNLKDENGQLLPDEKRLTKYGKVLRSSSLDELPELINIIIGNMSIVGPRPLLVHYLPLYNKEQKRRHLVRPGLTGYAQVNGRNALTWEQKFELDVKYVNRVTLWLDLSILIKTVFSVFKREGISSGTSETMEEFKGTK